MIYEIEQLKGHINIFATVPWYKVQRTKLDPEVGRDENTSNPAVKRIRRKQTIHETKSNPAERHNSNLDRKIRRKRYRKPFNSPTMAEGTHEHGEKA